MARPTIYSQEIIDKAKDYLLNYKDEGDVIPSVAGLALKIHVSRETIYDWSSQEEKAEFSDIVGEILTKQERTLVNSGLRGDFNSSITKLLLNKHGYREGTDVTSGGEKLQGVVVLPSKNENTLASTTETNPSA